MSCTERLEAILIEEKKKKEKLLSQVKIKRGKLHRVLDVPEDQDISDKYSAAAVAKIYYKAVDSDAKEMHGVKPSKLAKMIMWAANMGAANSDFWTKVKDKITS